jgi:hypothetical protein
MTYENFAKAKLEARLESPYPSFSTNDAFTIEWRLNSDF